MKTYAHINFRAAFNGHQTAITATAFIVTKAFLPDIGICCKKARAALAPLQERLPRELAESDVIRHWIQRVRQNITFIGKEEQ